MQIIEKYKWVLVAGIAVVVLGGLLFINNKQADESTDKKPTTSQDEKLDREVEKLKKEAEAKAARTGTTTYTAQPGDSYTVLARKAVQAYASATGEKVSKAQIVAAETFLTVDAGSPLLEVSQKVTIDKGVVAKAVAKAQALTAAEVAAWQVYVPYVNFDTSNNG